MTHGGSLLVLMALLGIVPGSACSAADAGRGAGSVSSPAALSPSAPGGEGVAGVVTAAGVPLEGAAVVPRSLDTPGPALPDMAGVTDHDGRYFWPLPPGNYEISVTADGYRPAARRVVVVAGKTATLDFALERAP